MFRNYQEINSAIKSAYDKYDYDLRVKRLKITIPLAMVFMVLFGILDLIIYPDVAKQMIQSRIFTNVFLAVTFYTILYKKWFKNIKVAGFVVVTAVFMEINTLVFISGEGAESPYYAGLALTIVALSAMLPWVFYETLFICCTMLSLYFVMLNFNARIVGESFWIPILFNNLFFLISTGIFCIIANHLNAVLRFKEFCLNYELEEKNKKLAAIDEMKSQFFANVSHEFRTPLTLILGPVQDVLHGSLKLPDKVASILDIIQQNALRLLKLVNDLLDITKLEERKFNVKLQKTEVSNLVSGLVDSMTHLASSKEIEIIKNIAHKDLFIAVDLDAMEKIILNLLNNAIKFTNKGGVIEVSTGKEFVGIYNETNFQSAFVSGSVGSIFRQKSDSVKKEFIVITIKDNGIGIDAENLPHIFERFKQVDSSSTRKYQGSGLGLSLVKELTELQGGKVAVESEQGKGTSFKLIFPIFDENKLISQNQDKLKEIEINPKEENNVLAFNKTGKEDVISNIHKMAVRARRVTNDDENGLEEIIGVFNKNFKTILVADDEPDMRYYIVSILKEEGYNIVQAKDGKAALEMVKKYKPDLVVLDLMMPEIDGLSVCDIIRKDEIAKTTKVIMLTARSDEGSKIQALQNGVDDFINKPFGSTEIKSRIKNLLQNGQLQKEILDKNIALNNSLVELRKTQSKLIQSEKINAIGSLSAGLLHEVNNPLNYTMTALQLIKMDPAVDADEDLKDTVKDIEEGMTRIKNIVSDLRAFAYPEEADKTVQFPIREAVESALRFTASENKDIEKIVNVSPDLIVSASKTHIVQVLINLVSNATKAINKAHREKGVIKVDAIEENGRIKISVSDNGTGMNEETLRKVFDPFFTTNEVGKGMGLGLSVSHTIIKNHGGNLSAESIFGEGSKFYFDLGGL